MAGGEDEATTVKIRVGKGEPFDVSNDEFRRLVREGVVQGDTPVWGRIFTNEEWWTAADLRMFHENSPVEVPKGRHLLKEERQQRRRQLLLEQEHREAAAARERLIYALAPMDLPSLVEQQRALGAARLWKCPAFHPVLVLTVVFLDDRLDITLSTPDAGVLRRMWSLVGRTKGEHSRVSLPPDQAPEVFRVWGAYAERAKEARSCSTDCLDGVAFKHQVLMESGLHSEEWWNPSPEEHADQWELIRAYAQLESLIKGSNSEGWGW